MSARLHVGLIGFTAVPLSEFDVDYQPKLESLDRRKPWENKVGLIFFPTHSGYAPCRGHVPAHCSAPSERVPRHKRRQGTGSLHIVSASIER